jgi:hypothetical protein
MQTCDVISRFRRNPAERWKPPAEADPACHHVIEKRAAGPGLVMAGDHILKKQPVAQLPKHLLAARQTPFARRELHPPTSGIRA